MDVKEELENCFDELEALEEAVKLELTRMRPGINAYSVLLPNGTPALLDVVKAKADVLAALSQYDGVDGGTPWGNEIESVNTQKLDFGSVQPRVAMPSPIVHLFAPDVGVPCKADEGSDSIVEVTTIPENVTCFRCKHVVETL